jgi:hypothetical protein
VGDALAREEALASDCFAAACDRLARGSALHDPAGHFQMLHRLFAVGPISLSGTPTPKVPNLFLSLGLPRPKFQTTHRSPVPVHVLALAG